MARVHAACDLRSDVPASCICRDKSGLPPKPVVGLGLLLLRGMNWFQNLLIPAPMRIADLTFGGWSFAEVVRTAAALGVADALAGGPMTAQALAKEIGALDSPPTLAAHPTPAVATVAAFGMTQMLERGPQLLQRRLRMQVECILPSYQPTQCARQQMQNSLCAVVSWRSSQA